MRKVAIGPARPHDLIKGLLEVLYLFFTFLPLDNVPAAWSN